MWQIVLWSDEIKLNNSNRYIWHARHPNNTIPMMQALIDPYSKILTSVLKAKSV